MALPVGHCPRLLAHHRQARGCGRSARRHHRPGLHAARGRPVHATRVLHRGFPLRTQHGPRLARLEQELRHPCRPAVLDLRAAVPVHRWRQVHRWPLEKLPANWPAQFERLTGAEPTPGDAPTGTPPRLARKIDTHLAGPLNDLRNEGRTADSVWVLRILKRLAVRNLLRGYRLALPTGQAVAGAPGIAPLTVAQILKTRADSPRLGVFGADSP